MRRDWQKLCLSEMDISFGNAEREGGRTNVRNVSANGANTQRETLALCL